MKEKQNMKEANGFQEDPITGSVRERISEKFGRGETRDDGTLYRWRR